MSTIIDNEQGRPAHTKSDIETKHFSGPNDKYRYKYS